MANNKITRSTDKISDLTMLFADISGFTEYSSTTTPEQVILF